jgi:hypothetical protein
MTAKRDITVRPQKRLPVAKTARLCLSGISHRFVRSALTLAVVVLAVAFFMMILAENRLLAAVAGGVSAELRATQAPLQLLRHLFDRPAPDAQAAALAEAGGDPPRLAEAARITGWTPERLRSLAADARFERAFLRFFDRLDAGKRTVLVRRAQGRDIFRLLGRPEPWAEFEKNAARMPALRPPAPFPELRAFVDRYPAFEAELLAFADDWNRAVDALAETTRRHTGGRPFEEWAVSAPAAGIEAWRADAARAGFDLDAGRVDGLVRRLADDARRDEVAALLNTPEKRDLWRSTFRERLPLDARLLRLGRPGAVELLDGRFSAAALRAIAARQARERRLAELERRLGPRAAAEARGGVSGRQVFLLAISLVVCLVGIANAMLMAITERFREIATMKCLGATDGFILTQFLVEATLQGVAGGLLGVAIGLALSIAKNAWSFGGCLFANFPAAPLAAAGGLSLAAGVLVSVLASVYPSWTASRMAPMEAMRVE